MRTCAKMWGVALLTMLLSAVFSGASACAQDSEPAAVETKTADKMPFQLTKALYSTKLDSFVSPSGTPLQDAAYLIVKKLAEQGLKVEVRIVGGTPTKPIVLGTEVNLSDCTCMEALEQIGMSASCEYQILDKVIRFLYSFKSTVRRVYAFERKFIVSGKSGFFLNPQSKKWEFDGASMGISLPPDCSISYSIPNEQVTVCHYSEQHPRIKKILTECYRAWKSGGKKDEPAEAVAKLDVIHLPKIVETDDCTVGEAVEVLNLAAAKSGVEIVLHKDIVLTKRLTMKEIGLATGGYLDGVLENTCAAIGASYSVKKNKVLVRLFKNGERTKRYRISAKKFSEMMQREVSSEEELIDAFHDMGVSTPAGTSIKWGDKKKSIIVKSKDVRILRQVDKIMQEMGISGGDEKQKKKK